MAMDQAEKDRMARLIAERDIARRDALEATVKGELRARGLTEQAARHLARSFVHETTIEEDGAFTRGGKSTTTAELVSAAASDATLLSGAFEDGRAPKRKAPTGNIGDLSTDELLQLDADRFNALSPEQQRAELARRDNPA